MIDLPPGTPVALYTRTSGDRQKKEETSKTQLTELRKECDRLELPVRGVYADEGVKNWVPLEERPEGQRLLEDAEAGKFEAVLVFKSGRLARDPVVFHHNRRLLGRFGVSVCYLTEELDFETPEGRFTSGIKLLVNDYEKDSQGDLMLRGKYRIADEGYYTGGVVDYGYRVTPEGKRQRQVPCPIESPQVERMYCLLVHERRSARQIACLLTAEGTPTATQRPENGFRGHRAHIPTVGAWSPQMVAKLLRKPIYMGLKPYGGGKREIVYQRVPALVSEELWRAAQLRLDEGRSLTPRSSKNEYLLARKVFCSHCGAAYTGKATQKGRRRYFYYECQAHRACQRPHREFVPCVPIPRFQCGWLDNDCWEQLVHHVQRHEETLAKIRAQWVSEDDYLHSLKERRNTLLREKEGLEEERLHAKRGKSRLGFDLTHKEAETLLSEVASRLEEIERSVTELTGTIEQVALRETRLQHAERNLKYWAARIEPGMSFHSRRHVIEIFLDRIEVCWEEGTVAFDYYFAFDEAGFRPVFQAGAKGGEAGAVSSRTSARMAHHCTLVLAGRIPASAA